MIGANLLRYKNDQRFLPYDVETEHLNLFHNRPWQISYAISTNKQIETIHTKYLYWKDLKVSPKAAMITRFDRKLYLERAEDPKKVWEEFSPIIKDNSIIPFGHNIFLFDNYILACWQRELGLTPDYSFVSKSLDTNCLFKAYKFNNTIPEENNLYNWQFRFCNKWDKKVKTNLGSVCKEFGIEYLADQAHDARYDIQVNHAILNPLIWKLEI